MRFALPLCLLPIVAFGQSFHEPALIPRPAELAPMHRTLGMECPWNIVGHPLVDPKLLATISAEFLAQHPNTEMDCVDPVHIAFDLFTPDTILPPEWYVLAVEPDGIRLASPTNEGLFRGSRTLLQLLEQSRSTGRLPLLRIKDHPRFPWRGMHLDVCRHFFPVDFVKKYIDLLARYKMNTFHWHLTEDQGWRIEIKKYPRLTEVGAWRNGSQIGPYAAQTFDTLHYGGFYTQEEIREVVAYASARYITIVPEIEMPGHAMAALASYPHLGCTGGPYEVQQGWGVFDDVFCAGNDTVFTFLEDVLGEVMDLFPGEYIHIGGDECPKTRWRECPKCQARMQAEGLKDEHELQSYFIQRIGRFVNSRGRKIIGWDEILEGGLAPNAAVMSWLGTEGGIATAKSGHFAVMSPNSHCYFDHYQGDPTHEPLAFGGHTTVQKVYGYEPIPEGLSEEQAGYILGAQGNVWTEYILTPEHVEYMAVPRLLALAEALWTPDELRDEADFIRRLGAEFSMLDTLEVNASTSLYQVAFEVLPGSMPGEILVRTPFAGTGGVKVWRAAEVPIEVGGTGIALQESTILQAHGIVDNPSIRPDTSTLELVFNLATARPVTLSNSPHERFSKGGAFTLVDGISGSSRRVDNEWLAWKEDVTMTVDLGRATDVCYIGIGAFGDTHSWIHPPKAVFISTSTNGKRYEPVAEVVPPDPADGRIELGSDVQRKARYIRVEVKSNGIIQEGLPGVGEAAWLFLDELEVR